MGKLKLTSDDLAAVARAYASKVSVSKEEIEIEAKGLRLSMGSLTTKGSLAHQGVQLELRGQYENGELRVDFE